MTITASNPTTSTTLSDALRTGTRTDHEHAETSGFVEALMAGRLPLDAYAALAAQQLAIYRTLETAVGAVRAAEPALAAIFDPALERTAAIEADLDFLTDQRWRTADHTPDVAPLPATGSYVRAIAQATPIRLLAHHYVRYLGDLSGGQIVRRRLEQTYGLTDAGLAFYTFAGIDRVKPYRDGYRRALDDLDLSAGERAAVVAEARTAFRHNRAVFTELGERWLAEPTDAGRASHRAQQVEH